MNMIRAVTLLAIGWLVSPSAVSIESGAQPAGRAPLPKVVLVGDSLRLVYAPVAARLLSGKADVISVEANGGDSGNVLRNLEEWVIRNKPDIVHLNAGLHDLKVSKQTRQYQVPVDQYKENLRSIERIIREGTTARLIFACTTPILDERHSGRGEEFDRFERDVRRYNETAFNSMKDLGVPVDDLHWIVEKGGTAALLDKDGTHYTPEGYELLGRAVADCVSRHITIHRYRPLPAAPAGPEAAAAYKSAEAEGDRLVPEAFLKAGAGQFLVPEDPATWQKERPSILGKVIESLGDLPPRPAITKARVISREVWRGFSVEKVSIPNGADGNVAALLLVPENLKTPAPAILWLHSSTPDKTQILIPNTNGGRESLGEAFTRAGYVVLSPDAYWHGDRVGTGPSGAAETMREEQESLFKFNLWMGRTLWGMFVRDDQIALDYLVSRQEVDRSRIGATGMSMGSTRAWWLAAVDERIAAVVGVACLTRYRNLIAHGQLRQHGVYYFVNGLFRHFDTEAVIALIAPRPFLALTGDMDAGSPADGIRVIEDRAGALYRMLGAGENFRSVLYPDLGHTYTPEMRSEMLAWFARHLKADAR
jgi:lysophospholipase L1-like esterase/dienelactone hydrolase